MPPRLARHDDYAAWRCACKHIFYRDDVLGGDCRFCDCTDHRPPVPAKAGGE